ncbi:MAG: NAD(P)-binding domain-containing protein [Clostridiales bacterium]|nr:NAD(P)-binding domain-containing protein [Clostridiales bacterium]
MEISGRTKVMGIIGSPVAHSLSPYIQNHFARHLDGDIVYAGFDVGAGDFAAAIKGAEALGIIGLSVTTPHKAAAAKLAVSVDALAKQADAVNLLKLTDDGYVGYNTDIYGVQKAFEHGGIAVAGKTVALIGAGGAGRACAIAMARMGAKKIFIANRTYKKAEYLAKILATHYNIDTEICRHHQRGADMLILATTPDYIPSVLEGFAAIFDVNYHPPSRIPRAFGGAEMLVYQAAKTYEIILGVTVPVKIIDNILNEIKGRLLC